MLDISDTMARRSEEIIGAKKSALAKGDDELAHRVGEGKDIMSILRTCSVRLLLSFNEPLTSFSAVKANTAAVEAERLSDEELVAQMS